MLILYISEDESSAKLKSKMTDSMWQQVHVLYHDSPPFLLLSDNSTQITDPDAIIKFLTFPEKDITFAQKLSNAFKAIVRTYRQLTKTGQFLAPQAIVKNRREICKQCPFKKSRLLGKVCTQCGCNIKTKTALITETCPLNKW